MLLKPSLADQGCAYHVVLVNALDVCSHLVNELLNTRLAAVILRDVLGAPWLVEDVP